MAEAQLSLSSFKKHFDDQLTCSVCLDQYTNPKTLPCHHSFCLKCIQLLPVEIKDGKYYISCPTCHVDHLTPQGGVVNYPNAFHINSLLDIQKKLTISKTTQQTTFSTTCPKHNDPLKIYCETCCQVICCECTISREEHCTHNFYLITECYPKHHQQIQDSLDLVKHKLADVNTAVTHLANREREVLQQGQQLKEQINTHAQQIIDQVQRSRIRLSQQVDTIVQQKTQVLTTQKQQAQKLHTRLKTCQDMIERSLKEWTEQQILTEKHRMMDKMTTVSKDVDPVVFQPIENVDMQFIATQLKEIGLVTSSTYGKASFKASPCLLHHPSTATLILQSHDGSPFSLPPSLISSTLSFPGDMHSVYHYSMKCDITQVHQGKYNITFTPSTRQDKLAIQVGGINIPDSPFALPVIPTPKARSRTFAEWARHFILGKPDPDLQYHDPPDQHQKLTSGMRPFNTLWEVQPISMAAMQDLTELGLSISFTDGSPPSSTIDVSLKVVTSRDFILPEQYAAVSGIYKISFSKALPKPVKIKMQHCVDIKNDDDSQLMSFAIASHPSPYKFDLVPGGHFPVGERYGYITRDTFCCFEILKRLTDYLFYDCWYMYFCLCYWTNCGEQKWKMHITVGKDLDILKKNCISQEEAADFDFKFSCPSMKLRLDQEIINLESGWTIKTALPCEIFQEQADHYGSMSSTPVKRTIEVRAHPGTQRELDYKIPVEGVTPCPAAIPVSRSITSQGSQNPITHQPSLPTSRSTHIEENELGFVYDLLKPKYHQWDEIGRGLGVDFNFRQVQQTLPTTAKQKLEVVIHQWFQSKCSEVTWEHLASVMHKLQFNDIAANIVEHLT